MFVRYTHRINGAVTFPRLLKLKERTAAAVNKNFIPAGLEITTRRISSSRRHTRPASENYCAHRECNGYSVIFPGLIIHFLRFLFSVLKICFSDSDFSSLALSFVFSLSRIANCSLSNAICLSCIAAEPCSVINFSTGANNTYLNQRRGQRPVQKNAPRLFPVRWIFLLGGSSFSPLLMLFINWLH